ncbi:MAG: serine/threonine-protein phosphatase [Deltaproteobacteria bacterium]|nr:serine/threonine-protein phosphatase [Deltaproteobacteria bacterium]
MSKPPAQPDRQTWQDELKIVVDLMRAVSKQTDPQELVRMYGAGVRKLIATDGYISISRRDLDSPQYRITRSSRYEHELNPWRDKDKLELLAGGVLGELLYGDEPRYVPDIHIPPNDPAALHLRGVRSLVALPHYDNGVGLNMTVLFWQTPDGYDPRGLPNTVWQSNLFGRTTHNLVMRQQLAEAYATIDREFQAVGAIQRSLLPTHLPTIPGVELAASYQTSARAGGDYYDIFPQPDGKWGIFIADVSGHGTPAAVMMAVTHAIAHTFPGETMPPRAMLQRLNDTLARFYTGGNNTFVTAFYGVYEAATRRITYASAGHNPPLLRRTRGAVEELQSAEGYPLGIVEGADFSESAITLHAGDQLLLYTDGISEAMNNQGDLFGEERLVAALRDLRERGSAAGCIAGIEAAVIAFAAGRARQDDQTMLVLHQK